ncbi:sensor histidine kinase [Alloiococcus sp. CFN-8]|uniref:sensor histidine kinase n=1 Tax=Alloiococcus sp. CFN-8 TaxID=3416081 RepID=UPI003CFA7FFA
MKAKGVFIKTLSMFFIVYLVLMMIFSNHIIKEEKEKNRVSFINAAFQVSDNVWNTIKKYASEDNYIHDITSVKKELLTLYMRNTAMEMALFDEKFELIHNTSDKWVITYSQRMPDTSSLTQFGFLEPKDWFSEEEISKMESIMYDKPVAKKVGDISNYYLQLKGFWVDGTTIIPEEIIVMEELVTRFDKDGNVEYASIVESSKDYGFKTNYQNTKDLPYFKGGGIESTATIAYSDRETRILRKDARQRSLREKVLDVDTLRETLISGLATAERYEEVGGFKQQGYIVIPFDGTFLMNSFAMTGKANYYAVFANEYSALQDSMDKLIPIWISSFIIFMLAGAILAYSNYNTYNKKEMMDKHHRELTNALAHDLKTPLAIISGYSENLRDNIHTEKREYYASKIQDKAIYMDGIIKEMLELSRLESGNVRLNKEELSLNELSQSVYNRYVEVINEKNIHFTIEGEATILGDRNLILKVIDNFIINAVSFTPENGRIEIEITDKAYGIFNSGSHIPEDKIDDIWTAYTKGDDSRRISQGTGLGLHIAGEILKLHKLVYGARNTGDGVRFWFFVKK